MVILRSMKPPIYVRPLSDAERESLEVGLRSPDAFTLRRCQILLASDRGENAYQIAHQLGCKPQTARNAIHAFNDKGLPEALRPGSKQPHTVHRAFDGEQAEALREMLHQDASPRSSQVRQEHESVDACDGCRGELRGGLNRRAHHGRDRPGNVGADGGTLGASQTLDHFPRSPLRSKKGGATD